MNFNEELFKSEQEELNARLLIKSPGKQKSEQLIIERRGLTIGPHEPLKKRKGR
jgi:hypothetical protein